MSTAPHSSSLRFVSPPLKASCGRRFRAGLCPWAWVCLAVVAGLGLGCVLAGTPAAAQTESVFTTFSAQTGTTQGSNPRYVGLIQASDGNFYGTTDHGGTSNYGVIFSVSPSGTYTVLHNFTDSTSDGADAEAGVIEYSGYLYGMTNGGGTSNYGTIYRISMTSPYTFTVLHSFTGGTGDGKYPYGALMLASNGLLYGLTPNGGASDDGIMFSISTSGTSFSVLHAFTGGTTDGALPYGGLVEANNYYYGTTFNGSAGGSSANVGTVFRCDEFGNYTTLNSFAAGTDGGNPYGSLIVGADGNLYGTYYGGGGGVFQISPNSPYTRTLLHAFTGGSGNTDGAGPRAALFQASDGYLYGTTEYGGTDTTASSGSGAGTIFEINLSGNNYTQLYSFTGAPDGLNPFGSLVQGSDGNLYGTTFSGGDTNSDGVIYKLQPTNPAAPVSLSASATTVGVGRPLTLTYSVANAYSTTMKDCFESNTGGASSWDSVLVTSPTAAMKTVTAPTTAGTYSFALTCGGIESSMVSITVMPAPTVTNITPTTGTAAGGTSVAITGTGFTGATAVNFGTTAATSFTVNSDTSITAVSPGYASLGAVDVRVVSVYGDTSSTSSADKFTYTKNTSTLTLTASPTSSTYGAVVTLTATVNNSAATGTVAFYSNGVQVGTGTVSGGVATLTSTGLPLGSDSVTASYGGDTADTASTSNTVVVTVAIPATAVGSTSASQEITFNFTSTVTLNATQATAVQVLTQGAPNLDFKYVSGGTCTAGTTYTSGQSCTVQFSFAPAAPGQRLGAVVLYNSAGTPAIVATDYISGLGAGPQADFTVGVQTTPYTGLLNPQAAAFDGAGNFYVVNYGTNSVLKYPAGSTTGSTFVSGLSQAFGVAVDGAGNVFIADGGKTYLIEVTAAGVQTTFGSGLSSPRGVAVDGYGTVYVTNNGVPNVVKFAGGATAPTVVASLPAAAGNIVLDAAGNIYVADTSTVQKIGAGTSTATTVATPGVTLSVVLGVAVDAAGNLYLSQNGNSNVYEIPASGANAVTLVTASKAGGLTLDAQNRVYVCNSDANLVTKIDRIQAAPLAFGSVAVGAASAAQNVEFENDGNVALTVASIAPSTSNFAFAGAVNGSTAACGTTLAAAGQCNIAATFKPKSVGAQSDNGIMTDNSLNVSGSTQTVALSGTATQGTKTVTFAAPPASPEGAPVTLSAYASDNDPIVFSITSGAATLGATTSSTNNGVTTYTATITYTNTNSVTVKADSPTTANATDAYTLRTVTATATAIFTAPTTNVGTTSATQTAVVTFTSNGTPSTISVLTLGAGSKDYNFVSGGTCSTTTSYSTNQQCTVLYTFTPSHPGQRIGAVVLSPTSGASLGAALLSGTGTGPLATFPGSTTIATVGSGFSSPGGVAVDGNGDVFVANYGGNSVNEILAGTHGNAPGVVSSTSTVTTVGSGFSSPRGVAVDGSGNVFVADTGHNAIKKIAAVKGVVSSSSTVTLVGGGFSQPRGLAVDSSGNVFVADYANAAVKEIVAVNGVVTSSSTVNVVGSGFNGPNGVAVDVNGNVFVTDGYSGPGTVYEIVAGTGGDPAGVVSTNSTVNAVASSTNPYSVTVDASGNVFFGDLNQLTLFEIVAVNGVVSSSSTVNPVGSGFNAPHGVALDGSGHLFVGGWTSNLVQEIDLTAAPAQAFASTAVGATSTDSPESVSVQNAGNVALTFSSLTTGTTNFPVSGTGTCATGSPLAESAICTVAASFTPQSAGALTDTFTLTDNSLNATSATQTVALSGTATLQTPTVTAVSPANGVPAGGTTVTITGTSFTGATTVKFGGTNAASFTIVSDTSITAVSPAGSGTVDITVSNGTYTSATGSADQFAYLATQTISFSPPVSPNYVHYNETLRATGGASGNPVTFSIVSGSATLSGTNNSTITYTGAGTVVIAANQAGNSTYSAAQATRMVTVAADSVFIMNSAGTVTTTYNTGASQSTSVSGGGVGAAVDASGYVWSGYANGGVCRSLPTQARSPRTTQQAI